MSRLGKKVEEKGAEVKKTSVEGTVLNNVRLNLWGTGFTLLGLQACPPVSYHLYIDSSTCAVDSSSCAVTAPLIYEIF